MSEIRALSQSTGTGPGILPDLPIIWNVPVALPDSEYLEENNLISDFQFGFRKKRSTELAAITLLEEIRRNVDSGCIVGACF